MSAPRDADDVSFAPHLAPTRGLATVVAQIRAASTLLSGEAGRPSVHRALPSREVLIGILSQLRAVFFPEHFGPPDLTQEGTDFYVGHTLDTALQSLHGQIRRALYFRCDVGPSEAVETRAAEITRTFASRLPVVRALLETDVRAAFHGDPAASSLDEAIFCYPGVSAITSHRIAHELYTLEVPLIPRIIAEASHTETGIDIHPGAEIGESFFIDHGTGVVIGETSHIGARVRLYQGVTLGAKSFPVDADGHPKKGLPRHPIVEDDVVIYAGATILGRIVIGRGASIGGNVWVTRSVAPRSQITQAKALSEVFEDGSGI